MKDRSILSVAGITAVVTYMVFSLVAFLYFPSTYGPFTNWLSDLGNPIKNPSGAVFYKLSGILTSIAKTQDSHMLKARVPFAPIRSNVNEDGRWRFFPLEESKIR